MAALREASRLVRAASGEAVDRLPVWLMRQAGRYLPEYQALRQAHDFLTLCETPELAAEVTLQPLRRFELDAAILFSDILLPLRLLGAQLAYVDGRGPQLTGLSDLSRIAFPASDQVASELSFVAEAIRLVRSELDPATPLIGFAGAPFTLLSYLLEGGPSTDFARTKALLNQDQPAFVRLLAALGELSYQHLALEVAAGADLVQLFDSWVGTLAPSDFTAVVAPVMTELIGRLRALGVPVIYFAPQTAGYLPTVARTGPDVVSVDWRVSISEARRLTGRPCQGNLDPAVLRDGPAGRIEREVERIVREWGPQPGLIFNLGHGVDPRTPLDHVSRLVEAVHRVGS